MNKTSKFLASAALGVAALGFMAVAANANDTEAAAASDKEKCYGVVKTGANDCASKANGHSCAGQASADANASEFVLVPTGLCARLANGSTTEGGEAAAPAGDDAKKDEGHEG